VTVGASGGIFGLLGALAAYFARNPNLQRSRLQLLFLFALVAINIALGTVEGSLIDNGGHIAAFAGGLWLGWHTCPLWQV
jgi:membrane associated rhomboid family serine protease